MSHNTMRRSAVTLALAAAIAAPALAAAPAEAKGGNWVRASGACAGGGVWTLKAKHDNGRIETEYEVDTNRAGQLWRVAISDNNVGLFAGNKRTVAPSGSFTVRLLTSDRAGVDVIRTRSTLGTHSCVGSVRV
ncbi:MAG: hypothetical protein QOH56_2385 [Pseudonocardiales bacterium]|jgi:hypothetical protein|nr:hypothetical protein [Pseudonocardiales bacterium]MDQ1736134.1 hypothetical protein [Pseudonocardiales bacterium]